MAWYSYDFKHDKCGNFIKSKVLIIYKIYILSIHKIWPICCNSKLLFSFSYKLVPKPDQYYCYQVAWGGLPGIKFQLQTSSPACLFQAPLPLSQQLKPQRVHSANESKFCQLYAIRRSRALPAGLKTFHFL